jgi:hypothetical protein
LKFSQEVYELMPYQAPNPQFHTFEVEGGIVGLSFCDKEEADTFRSKVIIHHRPLIHSFIDIF